MPDPTPISDAQIERLVAALRGHGSDFGWVLEMVGAESIASMTSSQAVRSASLLQRRRGRPEQSQPESYD
jgi:hypothetical protein